MIQVLMPKKILLIHAINNNKKNCKGSTEPSVSATFAENHRLNKNEEKNQ